MHVQWIKNHLCTWGVHAQWGNDEAFTDTNVEGHHLTLPVLPRVSVRALLAMQRAAETRSGAAEPHPGLAAGKSHGVLCWPYSSSNAQRLSMRNSVVLCCATRLLAQNMGKSVGMSALIRDLLPMCGQSVHRGEVDQNGCGKLHPPSELQRPTEANERIYSKLYSIQ